MGKNLPPQQIELYQRIDEILFYKWDPIGISDGAWVRDEYQSYLPQVFKLALENTRPELIANYLSVIRVEYMGLPDKKEHDQKIAEIILEIKEGVGL